MDPPTPPCVTVLQYRLIFSDRAVKAHSKTPKRRVVEELRSVNGMAAAAAAAVGAKRQRASKGPAKTKRVKKSAASRGRVTKAWRGYPFHCGPYDLANMLKMPSVEPVRAAFDADPRDPATVRETFKAFETACKDEAEKVLPCPPYRPRLPLTHPARLAACWILPGRSLHLTPPYSQGRDLLHVREFSRRCRC